MSGWDRAPEDGGSGGEWATILSVVAAVLFSAVIAASAGAQTSIITGRADPVEGDTIEIRGQHIRLSGIDAPDSGRRCGDVDVADRARVALRDFIGRESVSCSVNGRDRGGRLIARCGAGDLDIAEAMVIEGWARDWPYYSGGEYADDEAAARSGREGMWALQCPADLWGNRDYSQADASVETFAAASAPPDVEVAYVAATALNVRAGPGANHPVVDLLPHRERVEVFERRGEWALIHPQLTFIEGGWGRSLVADGWVASRYLSATEPE